jgi:hypothetical protein
VQDFICCLLEVDPTNRMSLTDTLRHPLLGSSASGGGDAALPSATTRDGIDRGLSDISDLSEFPEDGLNGANGDAWMFSAVPSLDDMPGVYDLNINSPPQPRARRPLVRRSTVLARELAVEAEAGAQTAADAEPAASGATPPAVNRTGGYGGKRRRAKNTGGDGSPVDVAMDGESAELDEAAMDVEPQPRTTKRGRRSQDQQQDGASLPTGRNRGGVGSGRLLRSRVASLVGGSLRSVLSRDGISMDAHGVGTACGGSCAVCYSLFFFPSCLCHLFSLLVCLPPTLAL